MIAAPLIIVLILLDTFDGVVARRRGQTSLMGSVLDIAADRTVEFLLWVVFADLDLIPIVFPLIVLTRGVFVDAIRAVAPSKGLTPFEMMRSNLGRFLVKSPWLRTPFAIAKASAFFFLALTHGLHAAGGAAVGTINYRRANLRLDCTGFLFAARRARPHRSAPRAPGYVMGAKAFFSKGWPTRLGFFMGKHLPPRGGQYHRQPGSSAYHDLQARSVLDDAGEPASRVGRCGFG